MSQRQDPREAFSRLSAMLVSAGTYRLAVWAWRRSFLAFVVLLVALLALPIVPTTTRAQHEHHEGHDERAIGEVHFVTSCSPAAQQQFDRGVALLHSFWFAPAREAFSAAAGADDSCGIAHWGVAMTWQDNPLGGAAAPANV